MSPNLLSRKGKHACTPHVLWEGECTRVSLDGEELKLLGITYRNMFRNLYLFINILYFN